MSVLSDRDILAAIQAEQIIVTPFDREAIGPNSLDVHLAPLLRIYADYETPLDCRKPRATIDLKIPEEGHVLKPNELYLGSTVEYTESRAHVPIINGCSSLGRLGLNIHATAGTGDLGFKGCWTLELSVIRPLRVYPGQRIGQILWLTASSPPLKSYNERVGSKYVGETATGPQASLEYLRHQK